jgi:HSP20 family protein
MRFHYSPIGELMELQRRVGRVFDEARAQRERLAERQRIVPPVDLVASAGEYVARFDVPGVEPGAVKVMVEEGVLTVRGTKAAPEGAEQARFARRERAFGDFSRSVPLPSDADTAQAAAKLESGVLTVRIGRRAATRQVEVAVE